MTSAPPPPPPSVPAGWYPQGDVQRYWNGSAWTEHTAPLAGGGPVAPPQVQHQGGGPLMTFASHIAGKNAQVVIYPDRVEWAKSGVLGGRKATEMIPMRSISSVTTRKDGLINTVVQVTTSGGVIEMRVGHAMAAGVRQCLMDQMLR